ncbi:MAG TPA: radical SAM protein, partial [Candidatus Limnocylindria bacterium]
ATDPYQPAEGRYRLTRGAIQALAGARTPFSLITRGPLIVRDVDVLAEAAARVEVTVNISIPTLNDRIWRATEPGTAHPRQRLRAVRRLADAGIRVGVGMAPILPRLSDDPELLRQVVLAARRAGAAFLWWNVLNLRPGTREHFLDRLAMDWPEQLDRYQRLYDARAYLTKDATRPLDLLMTELRSEWVWEPRRQVAPAPEPEAAQLLLPIAG